MGFWQAVKDAEASGLLQDDSAELRRITTQLAALPQQMVVELELKHWLGLAHTTGHRTWRKLRDRLIAGGFVAEVAAQVEVRMHGGACAAVSLCELCRARPRF